MAPEECYFYGQPHVMNPTRINLVQIPCGISEEVRCALYKLQLKYVIDQTELERKFYQNFMNLIEGKPLIP